MRIHTPEFRILGRGNDFVLDLGLDQRVGGSNEVAFDDLTIRKRRLDVERPTKEDRSVIKVVRVAVDPVANFFQDVLADIDIATYEFGTHFNSLSVRIGFRQDLLQSATRRMLGHIPLQNPGPFELGGFR